MSDYPFLSNPAQVQGRLRRNLLTLWVDSDFTRVMVGKAATLRAVAAAAGAIVGARSAVRCWWGFPRLPLRRHLDRSTTIWRTCLPWGSGLIPYHQGIKESILPRAE